MINGLSLRCSSDSIFKFLFAVVKEPKEAAEESGESIKDPALVKPTKAEKRLKTKKLRKEAKKQAKEEEVQQTPQEEVLVRDVFIMYNALIQLSGLFEWR